MNNSYSYYKELIMKEQANTRVKIPSEMRYINLILDDLKKAKTRKDVFKLKVIWTNHVPEKYDYLFSANIPEDLK